MTIAAGFRCKEGVILCADTQMTLPGWLKYPGAKIRFSHKTPLRPFFTFAGDVMFCEMFISKLIQRMNAAASKDILREIEDESLLIHQRFDGNDYEVGSVLLLSLWMDVNKQKRRQLFQISRGIVSPTDRVCIGTGRSVAQSMVSELLHPGMSLHEAALTAVYLLTEAKNYADGCGKGSHIAMLSDSGGWNPFPRDFYSSSIEQIEEDYSRFKRLLAPILIAHGNTDVGESEFRLKLEAFQNAVMANHERRIRELNDRVQRDAEREVEAEPPPDQDDEQGS